MLRTKVHGNKSTGSREEDLRVFTINGHDDHFGHVINIILKHFHFFLRYLKAYIQFFVKKNKLSSGP